jgi:pimeloyl-ACP methyl ester carboxylesterase
LLGTAPEKPLSAYENIRFRRSFRLPGWLAGCLMIPFAEWRLGTRDAISALRCRVLVIAGSLDLSTFPTDARQLFDAAPEPKSWWVVPGADHVDFYGYAKSDYERSVLQFIGASP